MVTIHEPGSMTGRFDQWPVLASSGSLEVRMAETDAEVIAAQRLRYRVFYEEMGATPSQAMREERRDFDKFDVFCDHMLVVDRDAPDEDGQPAVVGTYRLIRDVDAARAGGFYTAGEYDIAPMLDGMAAGSRLMELGRSCVLKEYRTKPGALQLLWRGVMMCVARFSIDMMFGCASLAGTDPDALALPLSYLHHFHRTPSSQRVRALPALYVEMNRMPKEAIDPKEGLRAVPPLIKGYLRAGATIGDGAVIDNQFRTTDVFIHFPLALMDPRYKSRFGVGS
ncbi:MAG TPA: GNAT family N-acyltransferase [Rhizomicrobium sp.]|nr:GNAT family N-acyltransferase [Rhizomicrobium sp.]